MSKVEERHAFSYPPQVGFDESSVDMFRAILILISWQVVVVAYCVSMEMLQFDQWAVRAAFFYGEKMNISLIKVESSYHVVSLLC